jgi:acetyl esterase/lipase
MKLPGPTHANVPYGPHDRNVLDVWRADSSDPRPVAVMIHGGGWKGGDKRDPLTDEWALPCFEKLRAANIHVASINYRYLSPEHPLPAPLADAARAIQFLRSQSDGWGFDKKKVAAFGASAGGCSTLWLSFHDDMAEPDSDDPVLRESTRLLCSAAINAQCSIYPPQLREWGGALALEHGMIATAFGLNNVEESFEAGFERLYLQYSPYTHLRENACPVFLHYQNGDLTYPGKDIGHAIHHPHFGIKVKQAMDAMGIECWLDIVGANQGRERKHDHYVDFLIEKLLA